MSPRCGQRHGCFWRVRHGTWRSASARAACALPRPAVEPVADGHTGGRGQPGSPAIAHRGATCGQCPRSCAGHPPCARRSPRGCSGSIRVQSASLVQSPGWCPRAWDSSSWPSRSLAGGAGQLRCAAGGPTVTSSQTPASVSGIKERPRWMVHSSVCSVRFAPANLWIAVALGSGDRGKAGAGPQPQDAQFDTARMGLHGYGDYRPVSPSVGGSGTGWVTPRLRFS